MDMEKRWCDLSVKEYIKMERGPLWAISWGQSLLQVGVVMLLGWVFMRWKRRRAVIAYDKQSMGPSPLVEGSETWWRDFNGRIECRRCAAIGNVASKLPELDECPTCGFNGRRAPS
jgi:hypothetical protein